MKLPTEFLDRMKQLLGEEEFEEFLKSYDQPRYYGLRINTIKISVEDFLRISPFDLEPVPWTDDGFYYPEGESPGRHPYYHAGLFYIQEPSAMLPGAVINAMPGERVLDLCAAPGGKTVQMAAGMKGQGLLVANDINPERVKALVKNIELCGVRNAIVLNESPDRLSGKFEGFFDKILVDAPCSGEGMFRKDESAIRSWEKFKSERCANLQEEILQHAEAMLKPGGILVYSTCTFAPEENEKMISGFINKFKDYEILSIPLKDGMEPGRPQWADGNEMLSKTVRLWPHRVKGEGHFVAMLRKKGGSDEYQQKQEKRPGELTEKGPGEPAPSPRKSKEDSAASQWQVTANDTRVTVLREAFDRFVRDNLNVEIRGFFSVKGNNLYCLPVPFPDLGGLKIAKFGWYLGEFKRDKFEPSHSLAVSLSKKDFKNVLDFSASSREVTSYLKGETLMAEGQNGLTAICVDGYVLGWAKQTGGIVKNLYPKGWRRMA